ncbi:MAG: GntR family transcriptional regulator [Planctomycetes bacterium]|nr:GntR family transcriptional regulator [Planctomycetota bacterium]
MQIIISNASPDPIYEQIARQMKRQIIDGALPEGAPLPSIRRLAKDLEVSVITTKRVYEELEKDGFIDAVAGKGTFVAARSEEFLHEMKRKLVEETLADAVMNARMLGIPAEEVHEMIRLLWEDEP